tara:strand:+ start:14923 stop:16098 length:1176 start_codon:yes stop_codon:yes gene_type:complete
MFLQMSLEKNKILISVLISTLLSLIFFYFLFFLKISFEKHYDAPYLFSSVDKLEFHKKYSKKIHHLRDSDGRWEDGGPEEYLFSIFSKFSNKKNKILFQGDSWMEQINLEKKSYNLVKEFATTNNIGIINGGITSFSPSLMKLQYQILEKDFNFKPNVVVAYIDQTDLGDELCRYKDQSVYDKMNNLVNVKNESHSRATYDYTKLYEISKIKLKYNSKFKRNIKLTNFFISYAPKRLFQKIKSIKKYGWEDKDKSKCYLSVISEYLINNSNEDLVYFKTKVEDYINMLLKKDYIDKIIIVTFPHRNHIFETSELEKEKRPYLTNVSGIIENIVKDEKKIKHLNFTNLVSEGEIKIEKSFFVKGDAASHLTEEAHANIFTKNIINIIKKNIF